MDGDSRISGCTGRRLPLRRSNAYPPTIATHLSAQLRQGLVSMSTAVTSSRVQGEFKLQRPTTALVGWMAFEEAAQWVAGQGQPITEEHRAVVQRAHELVAARGPAERTNPITAVPAALTEYVVALRANPASAMYFQEGWEVAIADLRRLRAMQPRVLTDDATERVAGVDPDDIQAIAAVALPLAEPRPIAAMFDQLKQAWVFSSANPNLRIAGQFHAEVQAGMHGFGFVVATTTSFIQVARYRDLCLLRDGYHRAYGFLGRGIYEVPVFVREFQTFDEFRVAGMLPQDAYLGERPPYLTDYLDGRVSATALTPLTQKVVMVQGVEIATLG
jgi:hypothetical protein